MKILFTSLILAGALLRLGNLLNLQLLIKQVNLTENASRTDIRHHQLNGRFSSSITVGINCCSPCRLKMCELVSLLY